MATPHQQQTQQRKILYLALILVLFTAAYGLRAGVINAQAEKLALREQSRGEVELLGSAVRLGLIGSRGFVTCFLWNSAFEAQKKNQWNELELTVRVLTRLQPHFVTPWLFQSWNLAYNVSVEADRPRDKFFYVARGVELLARGERQNANQPDLRWSVGFYTMHKIGRSDETNYMRSLFQLSMIPPNERDAARFWIPGDANNPEARFNYAEFEKFCKDHPQLVRRLREGMHRDNRRERSRLFTCERPEDVVQFLEDNFTVPGLYEAKSVPIPPEQRAWNPNKTDVPLPELDRFPSLPAQVAERTGWPVIGTQLGDEIDSFLVAGSWFSYAQEPIPGVDKLPGSTLPITDRARQRRPKHMTTLIFRNYPAQARRYHAERLQEEGWFDEEPWDASEWFRPSAEFAARDVKVGGGRKWSLDAWRMAYQAWRSHGEETRLLFPGQEEEQNVRRRAEEYNKRVPQGANNGPAPIPPSLQGDTQLALQREAAQWVFELNFYRQVSNFMHHYNRCLVEQNPETVAGRKAFFVAEKLNFSGDPFKALRVYRERVANPAWGGASLSPIEAWRDLVLRKNKEYRNDSLVQEYTAEIQFRFQQLENRFDALEMKRKLAAASAVVPLLPTVGPEAMPGPVTQGPFDMLDDDGQPFVSEQSFTTVADRMQLPSRRRTPISTEAKPVDPMLEKR